MQTSLNTFNPDIVFAHLQRNDWAGCWDYLQQLLESFSPTLNMAQSRALQDELQDQDRKAHIENFGALAGELILSLLTSPDSKLPDKNFLGLINCHEVLHNLFSLNGLKLGDVAIQTLLQTHKSLTDTQQKKILLLLSLATDLDIVAVLRRIDIKYRVPALCAYFAYSGIFETKVYENKIKLYALRHDLEKGEMDIQTLSAALSAYFKCSYLDFPDKHRLKENINTAMQKFLNGYSRDFRRLRNAPRQEIVTKEAGKPHLVVLLEILSRGHAMTRSWGEWIKSLSSHFTVSILLQEETVDPAMRNEFPNVVTYSSLGEFVSALHNIQPEVLALPSAGMSFWGVAAANMRLAPIQIMGLGHPASTMSPYIDYVFGQSQLYQPQAFVTEKFIIDDSPYRFIPVMSKEQVLAQPVSRREAGDDRPIRIAVVGTRQKITAPFLSLLQTIEQESPHPLHFSFHLGTAGLDTLHMQQSFKGIFKNFTFHGYQSYEAYFTAMQAAELVLNPFPFGHTNTLIDTLLLGKPSVGLTGMEPSARTELYVLNAVGLADRYTANSLDEYKTKALNFIDEIKRGAIAPIDRAAVYDALYKAQDVGDYGAMMKWIIDNHAQLKASPQRAFKAFESLKEISQAQAQ